MSQLWLLLSWFKTPLTLLKLTSLKEKAELGFMTLFKYVKGSVSDLELYDQLY